MPQPRKAKPAAKKKASTVNVTPAGGELVTQQEHVPAPDITETAAWMAFDAADEEQIITEIVSGELLDALVYEFKAGGKTVRGVSYAGINWCVREMALRDMGRIGIKDNGITIYEGSDVDGNPVYKSLVVAVDRKLGTEAAGMADAAKFPKDRNGQVYSAPHAERIALSKAQRNAKAALVPEGLKAELLAKVKGAEIKRVNTVRGNAEEAGDAKGAARARGTTAAAPKREGEMINAGQQRALFAKLKEGGGEEYATELGVTPQVLARAVVMWIARVNTVDRVPKRQASAAIDAALAVRETVQAIVDWYGSSDNGPDYEREVAHWIAKELPEFAKALGLQDAEGGPEQPPAEAGDGEQQAMV